MKLNGVKVKSAYEEVVVFPRTGGPNLVFKARAIYDFEAFEKLCPPPEAPLIQFAGQDKPTQNVEDVNYLERFQKWAELKSHWMVLQSLRATPGLEWETVDYGDHTTWKNYQKEMSDAGLTPAEQARIVLIVSLVNGLDQSKIDEATESFLVAQAAREEFESSPASAPSATPSGELVSASESAQKD